MKAYPKLACLPQADLKHEILLESVLDDSVLDVRDVDDQNPAPTVLHMPPRDLCMEVNSQKMITHAQSAGRRESVISVISIHYR